jgi:rsbT co-antagonist protein RsbR
MSSQESLAVVTLRKHRQEILSEWIAEQSAPGAMRSGLIKERELKTQSDEFMELFLDAARSSADITSAPFAAVREFLQRLSHAREQQRCTPSETATFIFSLKRPWFDWLRRDFEKDPATLFQEVWSATELLDKLGLYTTEVFQKGREAVINRQQAEMLELSTPVVQLWEGVVAVPVIGTLDSNRTQIVMETLLTRIVETESEVAIIDITGVPTVDTMVAQHLMKAVSAARLMGVQCIISGIRPQIAQTIVHLGIDLGNIVTKATLADAFKLALRKRGSSIREAAQPGGPEA